MDRQLSKLELELISILDNFSPHELSEQEKKAIHNKKDYPIISIIDGLFRKNFDIINGAIFIDSKNRKLFHQYLFWEKPWIDDFKYYYGENHRDITDIIHTTSFCDDFKNSNLCKRYRLYFAAKHPDKIKVLKKSWLYSLFRNYKKTNYLAAKHLDKIIQILKKSKDEGYKKTNAFLYLVKERIRAAKENPPV